MLGMGYGMTSNNTNKSINNMVNANAIDLTALNGTLQTGGVNLFGPVGSAIASRSAFDLTSSVPATAFDLFHPSQLTINNNCLTLATTTPATELLTDITGSATEIKKVDLEVPEEIVNGILGPAGRSLLELQYRSGALVQVSKKGLYNSGMNNRVVTISGTPTAVATAQFLIEHQISEMDMKRLRNSIQAID